MKNVLTGIGIVVAVALLIGAFILGKRSRSGEIADLMRKYDSIAAIPPDTIIERDTIRPEPVVKWFKREVPVPVPVPEQPNLNSYEDSITDENISIYTKTVVKGLLMGMDVGYKLHVPQKIIETVTVTEQVPVLVKEPTHINGFLLGAGVGGGADFAYSIGAGYRYNDHHFGVDYLRFGETSNWMVSYKYLLFRSK